MTWNNEEKAKQRLRILSKTLNPPKTVKSKLNSKELVPILSSESCFWKLGRASPLPGEALFCALCLVTTPGQGLPIASYNSFPFQAHGNVIAFLKISDNSQGPSGL